MPNELVVSVYREDFSWIPSVLDTGKVDSVVVYNKGGRSISFDDPRIRVVDLPNVGREGETFLHHIIHNWSSIPNGIWFAQGGPFDHSPDFVGLVGAVDHYGHQPYWSMSHRFKESAGVPPNHLVSMTDAYHVEGLRCANYFVRDMQLVGHCSFLDHGICNNIHRFKDRYRTYDTFGYLAKRLGIATPGPITDFAYGACFYTQGACIRRHPKWVYEELRRFLLESNDQGHFQGYILERFWPYLVCGRSYDGLSDAYRGFFGDQQVAIWNSVRKRLWLKKPRWEDIVECRDSVAMFFDGTRVRHLPGINLQGRDEWSRPCDSVPRADEIMTGLIA